MINFLLYLLIEELGAAQCQGVYDVCCYELICMANLQLYAFFPTKLQFFQCKFPVFSSVSNAFQEHPVGETNKNVSKVVSTKCYNYHCSFNDCIIS
jgi:hypothetical protein